MKQVRFVKTTVLFPALRIFARLVAGAAVPVWLLNILLFGIIGVCLLGPEAGLDPDTTSLASMPAIAEPQPTPTQRPGPHLTADGFPLPAGVEWTAEHEAVLGVWARQGYVGADTWLSSGRRTVDVLAEIPEEIRAAKNCLHWQSEGCRPVPKWAMPAPKCDPWPHEGCIREYSAGNYPLADSLFYYP